MWALKLADFSLPGGEPTVTNLRTLRPGRAPRFYESHGISPDGRKILFSGNPDGQDELGIDIYTYDLKTGELRNLTSTPEEWDEHAQYSPDGRRIVWMSSRGLGLPDNPQKIRSDYWIMSADGSNQRRLTYFNEPGHPEYVPGGATAADSSWGPNGKEIVAYIITNHQTVQGDIDLIEAGPDTGH